MSKNIKFVSAIVFLIICIFVNKSTFGVEQAYIRVNYRIAIEQQKLRVTAELSNIKTKSLYISFSDREAGIDNLSIRISDLKAMDTSNNSFLDLSKIDKGLYKVNTEGNSRILLTYDFDPNVIKHNFHLTTLTSSYLHIPGLDFFIRVFDSQNEIGDLDNVICKDFVVNLDNLPKNWESIVTYPRTQQGGILLSDYEALITAGNYEISSFDVGGCNYTIAFDKEKQFNSNEYKDYLIQIINYYHKVFKNSPISQQLIVINQSREKFGKFSYSLGGQAKNQNIIMELGGVNTTNQDERQAEVLKHMSHELFHIWISRAFNVGEDWSWFWEGFTEYQALRTVLKLGVISESEFKQQLAGRYYNYDNLKDLDSVNLVEASTHVFDDNEGYSTLVYDKGTLVAYLYDKKLKQSGKDFDLFISEFYKELALPQNPIKNKDIVEFMNKFIEDDSFTKDYISGTAKLPIFPLKEFGIGYYIEYFKRPPPFPFNFLIPIAALLIIVLIIYRIVKKKEECKNQEV